MTSRERVRSACLRGGYDRIPVKHEGTPEINQLIKEHFGLINDEQLRLVLGDDFRYVEPAYIGPPLKTFPDGSMEGYFGERYQYREFEGGKYLESVYRPYEGINDVRDLDRSHFPSADWFDYSTIYQQAYELRQEGFAVCCGTAGDMDFINGISRARGMEHVLIDLMDDNPVYLEIMQARYQFYFELHKRILEAGKGLIDFAHAGEDLGNQAGPMINLKIFEKHFAPKYGSYFSMVHRFGCRTMLHMCGTVWMFLPRLIELGLDVYDVVQPTTFENSIENLKKSFGDVLVFQGSMDVQKELAFGSVNEVISETQKRLDLFPEGGLLFGPSHAIQVGSPLPNILAMYRTAGSLMEDIPSWVYDIEDPETSGINMSKLF
ncbi:MAG TPA: uroporphyrinogen decarboxylase family protein [Atribacteraceae bacterium]|nr:uroporphyrinogen decarboxylase family protein [Atribacteraceae bacterium]